MARLCLAARYHQNLPNGSGRLPTAPVILMRQPYRSLWREVWNLRCRSMSASARPPMAVNFADWWRKQYPNGVGPLRPNPYENVFEQERLREAHRKRMRERKAKRAALTQPK